MSAQLSTLSPDVPSWGQSDATLRELTIATARIIENIKAVAVAAETMDAATIGAAAVVVVIVE